MEVWSLPGRQLWVGIQEVEFQYQLSRHLVSLTGRHLVLRLSQRTLPC